MQNCFANCFRSRSDRDGSSDPGKTGTCTSGLPNAECNHPRRFLKKDIPLSVCLKTDGYPRLPVFLTTKHTKRYRNICVRDKKQCTRETRLFFRTDCPRIQQKKAGFLFLSRTQQKDTKRHRKVRECSVPIIFVCFVCFAVKKADGLRTPCGKYTAGDSFLEITLQNW